MTRTMKKSLKIIIVGIHIGLLGGLSSCETALSPDPTSVITNASFWKTEDDANGALTGLYVKLRSLANLNLFIWGEARSEVMEWGRLSGTLDYDRYYNNTLNPTSAGPTWQTIYSAINDCNLILQYVPGISFASEQSRNTIIAQAYTARAFLYFVLARTWGEVPIRTEPLEGYSPDDIHKARASLVDVFQLIKQDIQTAESLYADNSFPGGSRNYWTKPGLYALKADVYLWTGKKLDGGETDFNVAIEACNQVGQADVALLPNFGDLFKYDNKNNKEIIMAIGNKEFEVGNNYFYNMYSARLPNDLDPITGEVIGQTSGGVVWTVTDLVKDQFTDEDTRKDASFIEWQSETFYPTLIVKGRGVLISGVRYFTSDFIVYRYADVLLMKAEAKNAIGQNPEEEINQIRQRAFQTNFEDYRFVNGSPSANDDAILKERLLELVFEGKRWWDLNRFDEAFEIVPSLQSRQQDRYLEYFPISEQVLSLEPMVKQTAGY